MSRLNLVAIARERQSQPWLNGLGTDCFMDCLALKLDVIQSRLLQGVDSQPPMILIAESHPIEFLASFVAASTLDATLLITNPDWGVQEWQQVQQMVLPDLILGEWPQLPISCHHPRAFPDAVACSLNSVPATPRICIPTGGTTGELRFVIHTLDTLAAAVEGFQQHFQQTEIHSCCVLPLYHVSGLMQFLRSQLTGGEFYHLPWRSLTTDQMPDLPQGKFWLSLVPTQLQRLLAQKSPGLSQFQGIFIGGGPTWPSLLDQARQQHLPLALTYGMTETAAQVATLHPQAFLAGEESCGKPLPHVQISFEPPEDDNPKSAPPLGQLRIQAKSLALAYLSARGIEPLPETGLLTDDLGYCDAAGYLHILGRNSSKIITGGENVFPAEVEAAIYSTGLVQDVCVIAVPDPEWGEVVAAAYVPQQGTRLTEQSLSITLQEIQVAIATQLSRYKHPKHWFSVSALPRNRQGKVNRKQLKLQLLEKLAKLENTI